MPETPAVTLPDLSARPFQATAERKMIAPPDVLYKAWTTEDFGRWFAAPSTLLIKPEVNALFFFEAHFNGERHPHYGRFLRLEPDQLVEMTWMNQAGTKGAETIVTIELTPSGSGTMMRVTHTGLPDEKCAKGHDEAWLNVLEHLDKSFGATP